MHLRPMKTLIRHIAISKFVLSRFRIATLPDNYSPEEVEYGEQAQLRQEFRAAASREGFAKADLWIATETGTLEYPPPAPPYGSPCTSIWFSTWNAYQAALYAAMLESQWTQNADIAATKYEGLLAQLKTCLTGGVSPV